MDWYEYIFQKDMKEVLARVPPPSLSCVDTLSYISAENMKHHELAVEK